MKSFPIIAIQSPRSSEFDAVRRIFVWEKQLLMSISIFAQFLCPVLYVCTINCYKTPAKLFVTGGVEIASKEGSTHGDPIAGPIYGIGVTPLLMVIMPVDKSVRHVAFADDMVLAS